MPENLEMPLSLTVKPKCFIVSYIESKAFTVWLRGTYLRLKQESDSGCPICRFIINSIPGHISRNDDYVWSIEATEDTFAIWNSESDDLESYEFELYQNRDSLPHLPSPSGRDSFKDPSSKECFSMIKGWIDDCFSSESHFNCSHTVESVLPKRVIDVNHSDGSVHLYTPPSGRKAKYVILSHCWGIQTMFISTTYTLKDREAGISFSTLPPSFQDAVTVARKLGVQYLWIDALCILQDSSADWREESGKMGSYYEDAFLTISAMDSQDSHGGFLASRTPTPTVLFSHDTNLYLRTRIHGTAKTLGKAPISERAWCYQERLLSRRILHFGHSEIIWECMSCGRRESTDEITNNKDNKSLLFDLTELVGSRESMENIDGIKRILSLLPSNSTIPPNPDFWYYLVTDFSIRKLKFQSDKIPAILGLVSKIRKATGFEFIQGLWREDMFRGLLWCTKKRTIFVADRIPEYPTWTWASIAGPVDYGFAFSTYNKKSLEYQGKSLGFSEDGLEVRLETRGTYLDVESVPEEESQDWRLVTVWLRNATGELVGEAYLDVDVGEEEGPCLVLSMANLPSRAWETVLLVKPSYKDPSKWVRYGIGEIETRDEVFEGHDFETYVLV